MKIEHFTRCVVISIVSIGVIGVLALTGPTTPTETTETPVCPDYSGEICIQHGHCENYCNDCTVRMTEELSMCSSINEDRLEKRFRDHQRIDQLMKTNLNLAKDLADRNKDYVELRTELNDYATLPLETICDEEILELYWYVDAAADRIDELIGESYQYEKRAEYCDEKHKCRPTEAQVAEWWDVWMTEDNHE